MRRTAAVLGARWLGAVWGQRGGKAGDAESGCGRDRDEELGGGEEGRGGGGMRSEGYLMGWCTGGSRIVDLRGAYIHTYISSSIPPPHSQLSPSQKQQTNLNIPPFFSNEYSFLPKRGRG